MMDERRRYQKRNVRKKLIIINKRRGKKHKHKQKQVKYPKGERVTTEKIKSNQIKSNQTIYIHLYLWKSETKIIDKPRRKEKKNDKWKWRWKHKGGGGYVFDGHFFCWLDKIGFQQRVNTSIKRGRSTTAARISRPWLEYKYKVNTLTATTAT